jgi:hypothetical protein
VACTGGELDAIIKLGDVAVRSLSGVLLDQPSEANREELRSNLLATHRKLKDYSMTNPEAMVPVGEEEYVRRQMEAHDTYTAFVRLRRWALSAGRMPTERSRKRCDCPLAMT